jgi:hypothetical protein
MFSPNSSEANLVESEKILLNLKEKIIRNFQSYMHLISSEIDVGVKTGFIRLITQIVDENWASLDKDASYDFY